MRRWMRIALVVACTSSAGCELIVPHESDFVPDLDAGVPQMDAAVHPPADGGVAMEASAPDASG